MRLLLDTHLLLWTAYDSRRLSPRAAKLIGDESNDLLFSAISIAEISIKHGRGRTDFTVHPSATRKLLLEHGYEELALTGLHAEAVGGLPPIHKDPFDRMLVAQAEIEGATLLTADAAVAQYGEPVRLVG